VNRVSAHTGLVEEILDEGHLLSANDDLDFLQGMQDVFG